MILHAKSKALSAAGALLTSLASGAALAADEAAPVLDKADTAWVMVAGLLVLLMTIPGIALFYSKLGKVCT